MGRNAFTAHRRRMRLKNSHKRVFLKGCFKSNRLYLWHSGNNRSPKGSAIRAPLARATQSSAKPNTTSRLRVSCNVGLSLGVRRCSLDLNES